MTTTNITAEAVQNMKVDQLRFYLRERGLGVAGSKKELQDRLTAAIASHATAGKSGPVGSPPMPGASAAVKAPTVPTVTLSVGEKTHAYAIQGNLLKATTKAPEGFADEYPILTAQDGSQVVAHGNDWVRISTPQAQAITQVGSPPMPTASAQAPAPKVREAIVPTGFAPLKPYGRDGKTATLLYRSDLSRLHRVGVNSYVGVEVTKEFGIHTTRYFVRTDGLLQPASSQAFGLPPTATKAELDSILDWTTREMVNAYSAFVNPQVANRA